MSGKVHHDVFIGIVIILLSIVLYTKTFEFIGEAALFPRALLILFAIFAVYLIYNGLKKTKQMREGVEVIYDGEEEQLTFSLIASPMCTLGIVIVYVALINIIGFFPSTILFIISFLWYMGVKNWKVYLVTSIGLNLFIYILFVLQLNVQLPLGIFFS
ncbi:tripartite tricarboxylate transporter TctB family protein [Bacillus sp. Marseille-P3661]|uniref:tripartite tricarboxylate transporter TctB family protein n=1 Tax=Bacillus sp. Marseille-P3661 TaxID=1936234 RepID=UPI0015E18399|nr:tripartite tricarboxylate transporter TctB family protein [Bacillus sp. Marseille-P3661]